eukprot:10133569-Alexandrium_andersonii.AAC.1
MEINGPREPSQHCLAGAGRHGTIVAHIRAAARSSAPGAKSTMQPPRFQTRAPNATKHLRAQTLHNVPRSTPRQAHSSLHVQLSPPHSSPHQVHPNPL